MPIFLYLCSMLRTFTILLMLLLLPTDGLPQRALKLSRWHIAPGDYSGITPLGGGHYAVVSDKDKQAGFHVWAIQQDPTSGKVVEVTDEGFRGTEWGNPRDQEGIAFCPTAGTVFISGEADQRILEHRTDGTLTGRELKTPDGFSVNDIQPNRGFEALCFDTMRSCFWTTTESALKRDEKGRLRLLCFDADGLFLREVPYQLSERQSRHSGRDYYHGIAALAALDDGTLLVLEREACIANQYSGSRCWCRIYRYWPEEGRKELVRELKSRFTPFNTRFANYEGLCLGIRLADGRQTVLLISDAQSGTGRALWHLRDRIISIVLLPEKN